MSRHTITLVKGPHADPKATLGYDPPLRTFFLQGFAFEIDDTEDFEIWLGTYPDEFPTLESLVEAARGEGFIVGRLQPSAIVAMLREASAKPAPSPAERLCLLRRRKDIPPPPRRRR